ncbi:PPR domain-containing protein/PPR_2 domain-containing protein [Cephalotus follicularis]|uniref:PPR domain-containing protein/PPR_2 domain-containing protein n=1 Tax=Cephalotus follicularis TaxID=3775 RepID=A0A1Q3CLN5_CEPFO|nr:PPR domain-containing protein/PPR_2 domain-containing protein [Cephalotus follicularis]
MILVRLGSMWTCALHVLNRWNSKANGPPPRITNLFLSATTASISNSKKCLTSSATAKEDLTLKQLLKQCFNLRHIQQTHGYMVLRALDQHNLLLGRLIDACSSLGFSSYASLLFTHNKSQTDIYLYNATLKALSPVKAIILYNSIRLAGLRPDSYSFPYALKAVIRLSDVHIGREIHSQTICSGFILDLHVATALVRMYSSCGCIPDARKLFDEMSYRTDVALWNAMVAGYAKVGLVYTAKELFEQMPERNVISWTAVIAGFTQMDRPNEAISLFRRMQIESVEPDEIAMLATLSACAQLGALQLGEWIHKYIDKLGLSWTVPLKNALINMYAKSGNINKAVLVFEDMKHKTVVTWTTIIAGFALHGLGRDALEMFSRMEFDGVRPNEVTFIALLSACSHVGLVELGLWYFRIMESRFGMKPTVEHYGCMIDLLGRAGYLKEAQEMVRRMPFEANASIWGSLLAASNIHGDAKLGDHALQHLTKLEPYNSGNYALLSNVYASVGRWKESGMVRKVMTETGVRKYPGGSFVEVSNRVHEFLAGDTSHTHFEKIHEVLWKINWELKIAANLEKECDWLIEFDEV